MIKSDTFAISFVTVYMNYSQKKLNNKKKNYLFNSIKLKMKFILSYFMAYFEIYRKHFLLLN